ncbi:MAG: TIGR03790 family protein [Planctomycetota bacterium]|nr:TIGR03790 family protein [Planctomycetota bacterium]
MRCPILLLAGIVSALSGANAARAQIAESTVLVVNGRSPESRTVARAWARLRAIPTEHTIVLDDVPATEGVIPVGAFRETILRPVRTWLDARGMTEQTTLVTFSVGFPYGVDFDADARAQGLELAPPISPIASLTSMTYLGTQVDAGDARSYLALDANRAFAGPGRARELGVTRPIEPDTDAFLPAAMLGYVGPNGSTVAQVLSYLERSSDVDGKWPDGTIYLLANDDVRANTREPLFADAVDRLRAGGFAARVLEKGTDGEDGILPRGHEDVLGLVAGIAGFDWTESGSTLVAGALAEHLTSFGAHFGTSGQTKCVRFLEAGAAGTCGTVAEPYAVQPKFPVPHLHLHYLRGASMVEAMYLSIQGPYQTLILGDPLCRPFASFAAVELDAPRADVAWSGTVAIEVGATRAELGEEPESVEAWVDGRRIGRAALGQPIDWDTSECSDGHHELRVVAVGPPPLRLRSRSDRITIQVRNHRLEVRTQPRKTAVHSGEAISVRVTSKGCRTVEIREGVRVIQATAGRTSFTAEVPTLDLGTGTFVLHAIGRSKDGLEVRGAPFEVEVRAPSGG